MIRKQLVSVVAVLAAVILITVSCTGSGTKYIIPEKKFVGVLVDVHLADGLAVASSNYSASFKLDSASLYGSVFEKHGVTRAMFDSTMLYYSAHPEDFQRMYNKVIARLKKMQEELEKQEQDERKQQQDSSKQ
jgi:hypothetical protein